MDTGTDQRSLEQRSPDARPQAGARARVRGLALPAAIVMVGLVALSLLLLVGLRWARPGVLPNVEVASVAVGGLDRAALTAALNDLATQRGDETVTATLGDATVTATNVELGYRLDVGATADAAWYRGRQGNPVTALGDHLRAFASTLLVEPVETIDEAQLQAWAEKTATALERPPVEGTVTFDGTTVERVDPRPGATVASGHLRTEGLRAVLAPGSDTIAVEAQPVPPETTVADVDVLAAAAERAVSAPVRLMRNDVTVAFSPEQIAALLEVERTGSDLRLVAGPEAVAEAVSSDVIEALETDPVDARFRVRDGEVEIVPSEDGFRFDAEATAIQLVGVAQDEPGEDGVRTAALDGEVIAPGRTTEDAEALGITEEVSTFTTHHACCQSRVTNIQRFADLMAGVLVEPGEELSLNEHVGQRTREKGFVGGGAIYNGEFVEQVGGGVSQFATTFFNAAWFGGYEILEHKPHSYYISRYPMGRESTINYPNVDVRIRNNSPYGLLVDTSYTSTSITVTFYGTEWVEVETITGEPHNYRAPGVTYRENNDLPKGESRVVQAAGGPGFDIVVTRVLTYPDGRTEREEFFTRYLPEDKIVERNT